MINNIQEIYPLSKLQKGILYSHAINERSTEYFEQMEFEIVGEIDINKFKQSITYIVQKYDILRTSFVYKETREPKQVVLVKKDYTFHYKDISFLNYSEQNNYYQKYLKKDRSTPFDLTNGSLLRFCLLKIKDNKYKLIFSFHHIILDGWSIGILFSELLDCYRNNLTNIENTSGYGEMIELDAEKEEIDRKYWNNYLKNSKEPGQFFYREASDQKNYKIPSRKVWSLTQRETNTITKISEKLSLSKSVLYETLWSVLLNKFLSSEDFIFGRVVSGRNLPGKNIEKTMGMFINTIPTRIRINASKTVRELMMKINKDNIESLNYESYPLDKIQRQSPYKNNLFNQLFVYENYPLQEALNKNNPDQLGFKIIYKDTFEQTNYDLNIIISPGKNDKIIMRFNERVYSVENINLLFKYYHLLIQNVESILDKTIKEIYLIDDKDKNKNELINSINKDFSKTIMEYFKKIVVTYSNRVAIKYEGIELTYKELSGAISNVQHKLKSLGIKKGDRIGIYMNNSIEQIVYILSILSMGASYVPIDYNIPFNRIKYMIKDSEVKIVIANKKCKELSERVFVLYAENISNIKGNELLNIEKTELDSEVCVIYTSGTTGNPKGVSLLNKNIERVVLNNGFLDFNKNDTILQLANYSFDGSLLNIFSALLNGCKLIIIPSEKYTDIEYLKKCIQDEKITKLFITTSLFNVLTDTIGKESFKGLKAIMFGGEKASIKHCKDAIEYIKNGKLINGYGPTECGIFTTVYPMTSLKDITGNIPIGKSVSNTQVYVANYVGQMLPSTIIGEIYVSGQGLSNGYVNNQRETKEKFIYAPIKKDTIFYKTGDLGYIDEKGRLHYVGRVDNQYKIRGHRIELEEIEANINKNSFIQNAIVKAEIKNNQVTLTCYFTSNSINVKEYRKWVKKLLPEYMVPKKFYRISKFKMNKNGKIDRDSLDDLIIEKDNYEKDSSFSELALKIKDAWEAALGQELSSKEANFYDIGGDSIKAIMLYSELQKRSITISMEDIISNPTIQMQEEYLLSHKKEKSKTSVPKIQLVSQKHSRDLVLFPAFLPQFANKNMGNILAKNINNYSIYVANFFDERNLYQEYADELEKIMEVGNNLTFLGYSFGGNIAFEVIKELEKRGYYVDQLILVDSYMLEKFWFADPKDLVIEVDKYLDEYLSKDDISNSDLRSEMLNQMSNYCDFINDYRGIYSPINSDIYMITSNEPIINKETDSRISWKNATMGSYYLYHGFGSHREMWRTNYLEKNMVILNKIIDKIKKSHQSSIQQAKE